VSARSVFYPIGDVDIEHSVREDGQIIESYSRAVALS